MLRDVWSRGALAVLATAAIAVTGCGGDDEGSGGSAADTGSTATAAADTAKVLAGSGGRDTGIGPLTGEKQTEAVAAGEAAAKAAGEKVDLPKGKKIGLLQVVGGIESADRLANAVRFAAKQVGYSVVYCDGQGVPATQKACADSLLSQKVDAIVTPGVDPSTIASQLRTAKSRGIPAFAVGGVQPPGYVASYGPNETTLGKITAERLVSDLKQAPQKPVDVAVSSFPTPTFADRTTEFEKLVKANSGDIKIAAESTNDFANLNEGTRKIVTDQLTQNPNLKAFWFAFDTAGQAAGQLLGARYSGKSFPDRPLLATFHADLATIELVRKGSIDIVGEVPYDVGVWVGMDQMLEFFAREKAMATESQPKYGDLGDLYNYQVVDKDNLPEKGKYAAPEFDVVTFFQTKWKNEFN